jgi:hypothetical protein
MYMYMYMCRHFVPNLTFGAPMVKCLRKKIPKAFFGEYEQHFSLHSNTAKLLKADVNFDWLIIVPCRYSHDGVGARKGGA